MNTSITVELDTARFDEALAAAGYDSGSQLALGLFNAKPLGVRIQQVLAGEGTESEMSAIFEYYGTVEWRERYSPGDEDTIIVHTPLTRAAISYWRTSGIPAERLLQVAELLNVKPSSLVTDGCRATLRTLVD